MNEKARANASFMSQEDYINNLIFKATTNNIVREIVHRDIVDAAVARAVESQPQKHTEESRTTAVKVAPLMKPPMTPLRNQTLTKRKNSERRMNTT